MSDISFKLTVEESQGKRALKSIENSILSLQKTANSASRSLRNITFGTATSGAGFTKFSADARNIERAIGNIANRVDNLRTRAVASRRDLRDAFQNVLRGDRSEDSLTNLSDVARRAGQDAIRFEREAARLRQIAPRFDFLRTAQTEQHAIKRNNIENLRAAKERQIELQKELTQTQRIQRTRAAWLDDVQAANVKLREGIQLQKEQAKIVQDAIRKRNQAEREAKRSGGGQGGFGGNNRFANASLVAGGALSGLTGNFGFLGIGFAAMSGGPIGAATVGFATAIGGTIRAASRFEESLRGLASDIEKLSPGLSRQVDAYDRAVAQLERGILIMGLGDRSGTSRSQQIGAGARSFFGRFVERGTKNLFDALDDPGFNFTRSIIRSFEAVGKEAERAARLEEELALGRKKQSPVVEKLIAAQDKLKDETDSVIASVDKQFKLQQEINRISRLVSFGGLPQERGAEFLARERDKLLENETKIRIESSQEMERRIREAAFSGGDKRQPTADDIKEMSEAITKAVNSSGDKVRDELQKLIDTIGENQIKAGRVPGITVGLP